MKAGAGTIMTVGTRGAARVSIQVPVPFDAGRGVGGMGAEFGVSVAQVGAVAGGIQGVSRIASRSTAS